MIATHHGQLYCTIASHVEVVSFRLVTSGSTHKQLVITDVQGLYPSNLKTIQDPHNLLVLQIPLLTAVDHSHFKHTTDNKILEHLDQQARSL